VAEPLVPSFFNVSVVGPSLMSEGRGALGLAYDAEWYQQDRLIEPEKRGAANTYLKVLFPTDNKK